MTEQDLKRVDVRVGLIGALRFMDGSPQGVRQLQQLHSQVGVTMKSSLHTYPIFGSTERCKYIESHNHYRFFWTMRNQARKIETHLCCFQYHS